MKNDWAKLLQEAVASKCDKVPKGYFNIHQLVAAGRLGNSLCMVRGAVNLLLSTGKLEARKFKIQTGGKIYPITHYRVK